jgi:hypothetical protein
MMDYIRKDWLRYNSPLRESDPIGARKLHLRDAGGGTNTQGRFGQRHAQETMTDRLTEGLVQNGTQ